MLIFKRSKIIFHYFCLIFGYMKFFILFWAIKPKQHIMSATTNYIVKTYKMNGNDNRSSSFPIFKKAYDYYCNKADDLNLDNAEYSDSVEMNHTAGGIGYDYRLELIIEESND